MSRAQPSKAVDELFSAVPPLALIIGFAADSVEVSTSGHHLLYFTTFVVAVAHWLFQGQISRHSLVSAAIGSLVIFQFTWDIFVAGWTHRSLSVLKALLYLIVVVQLRETISDAGQRIARLSSKVPVVFCLLAASVSVIVRSGSRVDIGLSDAAFWTVFLRPRTLQLALGIFLILLAVFVLTRPPWLASRVARRLYLQSALVCAVLPVLISGFSFLFFVSYYFFILVLYTSGEEETGRSEGLREWAVACLPLAVCISSDWNDIVTTLVGYLRMKEAVLPWLAAAAAAITIFQALVSVSASTAAANRK